MTGPVVPSGILRGFDMSIWAKVPDWNILTRGSDAHFGFIEVAHGIESGKSFAETRRTRQSSITCGPFQRLFSTATGLEQVRVFIDAFQDLTLPQSGLPPVLDVEYDNGGLQGQKMKPAEYLVQMNAWISAIEARFKRRPLIYTNAPFWREYLDCPIDYGRFPLWIANYSDPTPDIPAPWASYTFWQYASGATLAGCPKPIDLDCFAGHDEDPATRRCGLNPEVSSLKEGCKP